MKIEHELNIINEAAKENLPYAIWLSNDKKGKEPEATYDEETLKKRMNHDDIVLQLKHDFIETPGLPLGRFFYEAFKENSRGSKLHEVQKTISAAPRLVAEHTASLNRFTTAFSGARDYLETARIDFGNLIPAAITARNNGLIATLNHVSQNTENAVDALDNAPIPITYTDLSVSLNNAADHLDYLTGFYTNELNRPADANATRVVATHTRTAAADALSTTRHIAATIYT
ncbi:hypothetical protein AGMMS49936_08370 [Endomicrobiia bacterium]|nr:hypothetical protein AGMMS49936_08370 [Endomicrobiia bacterium]